MAVQRFGAPTTIKQMRSFLGFTNFYRCFVRDYAAIADPLTSLTSKTNMWKWEISQQFAFVQLKSRLMSSIVSPFSSRNTGQNLCRCQTVGFGALLIQKQENWERVLTNTSTALNKAKKKLRCNTP